MNKIDELKQNRSLKIDEMQSIVALSAEERKEKMPRWNELKSEVDNIDSEISVLETQERLNNSNNKEENPMEKEINIIKTENPVYDYKRAVGMAVAKGVDKLDGYEGEVQAEMRKSNPNASGLIVPMYRGAVTTSTGSGHISTEAKGLDILATPSMYQKLGTTIYSGLDGKVKLNFSSQNSAAFVTETNDVSETSPSFTDDSLEPKVVGGFKVLSQNYLSTSSMVNDMIMDFKASIDRAITAKLFTDIQGTSGCIVSGFGVATGATALTYAHIMKLAADVEDGDFVAPAYVASKKLLAKLRVTSKDSGSGLFIVSNGEIDGVSAWGSTLLGLQSGNTQGTIIYGDWKRAYVGFFGGVEEMGIAGGIDLVFDNFTYAKSKQIQVVYTALADVAFNPAAFRSLQNGSIA